MAKDRIVLSSTVPGIKDKIHTNIVDEDIDKVYWYIKFNKSLDKNSVSNKTMQVIDTYGFMMKTEISYDSVKNVIVVSPLESYMENKYYILSVSNQVRSEDGENLKREIHILFKLFNSKISKYEVLKSTAKVPKPKPRPDDYDELMIKLYTFTDDEDSDIGKDELSYQTMKINVYSALPGILLLGVSMFLGTMPLVIASAVLCAGGFTHIGIQLSNKKLRSIIQYNIGALYFNKEKYKKARLKFRKAVALDSKNERAEYALTKVNFYI